MVGLSPFATPGLPMREKLYEVNWLLPVLIGVIGLIGVVMIYAATDGVWSRGAAQHAIRIGVAGLIMLGVALIDIRVWYVLAYPAFIGSLFLLLGVEFFGVSVNGSQRWIDLGVTRVQPSELMKLSIVLTLARYYHDLERWRVSHVSGLAGALAIIGMPMILILRQPDLGTTLLLGATGVAIVFLAGVNWRIISLAAIFSAIGVPLFLTYGLADYQRGRILTFLNPSRDPGGASYHITQSKIALGSGGVSGKGFMKGTQRQGDYVPENRTDFIFTVIGEEFGLVGSLLTISLYIAVIGLCLYLVTQCKAMFSKLLILGLTTTFTLYIFINLGMVMGLMPVVGVPLPLISYGGTVILAVMFGFGLILSAHLHRNVELPRSGF
ncbi:cell elongation-specific peptidoglycan biosynthesis regulator RodA [Litorimonas taeanensis]|uniref:Peptidoglycan glycosyltransferase MrdB n=1 Tax=Litorimonas taeanensis TaxID=568099 RepID=A0A420WJJ4_9PROT|nr:rod shape-determining protein RodA [Litorimonas taeanensis]RKQ71109.1 cell elongation-specific peptidoglycan biosynthesis regulator RodA [Litorimonas taeanensis]